MKIAVAPDKFKGGLTSEEFCDMAREVLGENYDLDCAVLSDGGDGFLDSLFPKDRILSCRCTDANFFKRKSRYALFGDAGFCSASDCAPLAETMIKDPMYTTSYGLGEVVDLMLKLGKKKIYIGLGGTATNDAGFGMVAALGGKFYDENGEEFVPVGGNIQNIKSYDLTEFERKISGKEFIGVSDVLNPLTGKNGCSYVYAPQKGARSEDIEVLETNMKFSETLTGVSGDFPGAGAAGGIGYCIKAFFRGKIVSGSEFVSEKVNLEERIKQADIVITGEGKFDENSLNGKLCGYVAGCAKKYGKTLCVFCGVSDVDKEDFFGNIVEINDRNSDLKENIANAKKNLRAALERIFL